MNKIYKVIYCKATQTFVAVSEFAKGQGKGSVHGQRRSVSRAGSSFSGRMKLLSLSVLLGLSGQVFAESGEGTPLYVSNGDGVDCTQVEERYVIWSSLTGALGAENDTNCTPYEVTDADSLTNTDRVTVYADGSNNGNISIGGTAYIGTGLDVKNGATIDMGNNRVQNVATPTADTDAANKKYVDDNAAHYYSVNDGGTAGANYNNDGATGTNSLAAGLGASATGKNATTVGNGASALNNATAFGVDASSKAGGVAVGTGANTTDGGGTAVGRNATSAKQSVAVGLNSASYGQGAVAVGTKAVAGVDGDANILQTTAIGNLAIASGDQSTAVGANAVASGNSSVAIGGDDLDMVASSAPPEWDDSVSEADAIAANDTAAAQKYYELTGDWLVHFENNDFSTTENPDDPDRYQETTAGEGAVAVGVSSTAGDLGTAFGTRANADSVASVAVGVGSHATLENSVAIGAGSETDIEGTSQTGATVGGTTYTWAGGTDIKAGDVVSVGSAGDNPGEDGNVSYERQIKNVAAGAVTETSTDAINGSQLYSVAAELDRDNYFHINDTGADAAADASASTDNLADVDGIGGATGLASLAGGLNAQATGQYATAIGTNAKATKNTSTAVGKNAEASGLNAVALGSHTLANQSGATAIGTASKATNQYTTALGVNATASGINSVALGAGTGDDITEATGARAIAIGANSEANGNDSISIGTGNVVDGDGSGALGDPSYITGDGTYTIGNNNGTAAAPIAADSAGAFGNDNLMSDAADGSRIVGNSNNVTGANTFVVGNNVTEATADSNVILGNKSSENSATTTDGAENQITTATVGTTTYSGFAGTAAGIVSVGAEGAERQIINVAPGEISDDSTDAINGSQLYSVITELDETGYFHVNDGDNGGTGVAATNSGAYDEAGGALSEGDIAAGMEAATTGQGEYQMAIGQGAKANGGDGTIAIGAEATAKNNSAIAFGADADAQYQRAIAIGEGATAGDPTDADANGSYSVSVGADSNAYQEAVAIGRKTEATEKGAVAVGTSSVANKENSVALGESAEATLENSVALGAESETDADATEVSGEDTTIGSTTYDFEFAGYDGVEAGDQVSVGSKGDERQIKNVAPGAITKSSTDAINGSQLYAVADELDRDTYFHTNDGTAVVPSATNKGKLDDKAGAGGAESLAAGVNATVVGPATGGIAVGAEASVGDRYSMALGYEASANSGFITAIGYKATSGATSATAIGNQANAKGTYSIALGTNTVSSGTSSIAAGTRAQTGKPYATAMGFEANASGERSQALGANAEASGLSAVAVGDRTDASGIRAIAIGAQNDASGQNSISMGTLSNASETSAIALGSSSKASVERGVALGSSSTADRVATTAGATADQSQTVGSSVYALTTAADADKTAISNTVKGALGAVSVGSSTATRQIINVAAGTADSDAVNVAQLKAVANTGFNIDADNRATGLTAADNVALGDTVNYVSSNNTVTTTVDNNEIDFAVNVDNDTIKVNSDGELYADVTDTNTQSTVSEGDGIKVTETDNTDGTKDYEVEVKVDGTTTKIEGGNVVVATGGLSNNATTGVASADTTEGTIATVGDVANAINNSGFTLTTSKSDGTVSGTTEELINPGETITIDAGKNIEVTQAGNKITIATDAQGIAESAQLPVVYTKADGTKVYLQDDGTFNTAADGTGDDVENGDVITSMQSPDGSTTTPTQLTNVASTLPGTADGDSSVDPDTATKVAAPTTLSDSQLSNAATIDDVLSSGWNLQANGADADFVTAYDTVNFDSSDDSVTIKETTDSTSSKTTIDFVVNANGDLPIVTDTAADNTGAIGTPTNPNSVVSAQTVADAINGSGFTLTTSKSDGTVSGTTKELINPGETITIDAGENIEVTQDGNKITIATDAQDIAESAQLPVVYTKADGTKVYLQDDGTFNTAADGTGDDVENGDVITSMQSPDGDTTTPTQLTNVASTLPGTANGDSSVDPDTATKVAAPTTLSDSQLSNAATIDDVLSSGWNLQANGADADFVTAYDTVNFDSSDDSVTIKETTDSTSSKTTIDFVVNANGDLPVVTDTAADNTGAIGTPTNPDSIVSAQTVADAINGSGFTLTTSKSDGTVSGTTEELINPGETITIDAGENIEVTQDGNKITIATDAQDIAESAQLPVVYTDADGNKVYLQDDGTFNTAADGSGDSVDSGDVIASMQNADGSTTTPTSLSNVASTLPGTGDDTSVAPDTASSVVAPTLTDSQLSNAATVDDVLSAGWNLQEGGEAVDFVTAYDTVNFTSDDGTVTITSSSEDGTSKLDFSVKAQDLAESAQLPVVYTDAEGNKVYLQDDGTFNTAADGSGDSVDSGDVIASMQNADGTTTNPTNLSNVASTLPGAGSDTTIDPSSATSVAAPTLTDSQLSNAATVDDVLSAGWNLGLGSDAASATGVDFVTAYDTVNFVDGNGTTARLVSTDGSVSNITYDINYDDSVFELNDAGELTLISSTLTVNDTDTVADGSEATESTTTTGGAGSDLTVDAGKNINADLDGTTVTISTAEDVEFNSVASDSVAVGDTVNISSDGIDAGNTKITNVAAGTDDSDAVNVSQLSDVADDVANNTTNIANNTSNIAGNTTNIANNTSNIAGNTANIANNASNIAGNTTNIANNAADIATNLSNITTNAADIAENADNIALGLNFAADSGDTVNRQLGDTVDITGDGNITTVTTDSGVEVQLASDLTADSLTTGNTVVNTDGITIAGDDDDSTVSLTGDGLNNGGNTITNVAAGVNGTDAVNVNQLNSMGNRLSARINEVEDEANAGTASALAAANLPQPHDPGASMVSAGLGYYEGEGAFAVGVSTISDNGRWILKGSATVNTESNVGVGAGIGYQW